MKKQDNHVNRKGWIVVIILMLAYTLSFLDRNILTFLVEPMKEDFGLSDTEVSLLLGVSFGLFYAIMGIPIGRLADVYSRKKLIAIGVALWSVMTAFCGASKSYGQFFLSRMGVGVGEATLSPASYSILSDYFPKEKLATAISVYSLGIYLGSALAAKAGGYAVEVLAEMDNIIIPVVGGIFAWQLILIAIGIPGLIIALLVLFIKEPKRKGKNAEQLIPLSEVWSYLLKHGKAFFLICTGAAFFYLAVYAISSWLPTYLMRIHQMSAANVGNVIAIGFGIFPAIGVIGGGRIADYWTQKGVSGAKIKLILWATLLLIPFSTLYPLMPSGKTALIAMIPLCLVLSAPVAATAAAVQEIMPNRMRGIASSILILSSNLLGLTIGPTSIALFTDYYFQDEMALGWSLLIVSFFSFSVAGLFFYWAYREQHEPACQTS